MLKQCRWLFIQLQGVDTPIFAVFTAATGLIRAYLTLYTKEGVESRCRGEMCARSNGLLWGQVVKQQNDSQGFFNPVAAVTAVSKGVSP